MAHSGSPMHPSTAETLLVTLSDLYSIHALLPHTLIPTAFSTYLRFRQLGTLRLIRGLMVVWLTWFILGTFIGFHSLLAIAGTVFLLLPSPPLAQIIHLLNQSLIIRRTVALAFLFTFGSPPDHSYPFSVHFSPLGWAKAKWAASRRPSLAFSFRPKGEREVLHGSAIDEDEHSVEKAGNPIYFRFEVHENQRWWMGLDWTSALLPQERPSWCDAHLLPVSPPLTFSLPSAASIILPAPTKLDPRARVKRIASWRWLDDDWVIVRAGGAAAYPPISFASPIEPETEGFALGLQPKRSLSIATANTSPSMANPSALEDGGSVGARTQSIAEQAFTKGLERLKARTSSPVVGQAKPAVATASPSRPGSELKRGRTGSQASEDLQEAERVSTAPVETITAKDDVRSTYHINVLANLVRRRTRTVGCMGTISGRVWEHEADWAKSVFASAWTIVDTSLVHKKAKMATSCSLHRKRATYPFRLRR